MLQLVVVPSLTPKVGGWVGLPIRSHGQRRCIRSATNHAAGTATVDASDHSAGPRLSLKSARPGVLHMLDLGGNNNAVMVTAVARPDADQLVGLGVDEGDAAR